jgi:biotin synthase
MPEHPESFPVNALVPIPGTPLENNKVIPSSFLLMSTLTSFPKPIGHQTLLRTISTARLTMPTSIIRLAAGRQELSEEQQMMCFLAGANAVFTGEKMLTTPCASLIFFL